MYQNYSYISNYSSNITAKPVVQRQNIFMLLLQDRQIIGHIKSELITNKYHMKS